MKKKYYSERNNYRIRDRYTEDDFSVLFVQTYYEVAKKKLFEELFGYTDNFGNNKAGLVGNDFNTFVFKKIGIKDLVPFDEDTFYPEGVVFDLIELLYDYSSLPNDYHEYNKEQGQIIFLNEINPILNNYDVGYELTLDGYIRKLIDNGLESLVDTQQEYKTTDGRTESTKDAKTTFFKYGSTEQEKRGAILEIGRQLEFLHKSNKLNLNKNDASDLFNLLNSFNLRHNKPDQKPNYDTDVFYPWIFYNLLAALDASLKLQTK